MAGSVVKSAVTELACRSLRKLFAVPLLGEGPTLVSHSSSGQGVEIARVLAPGRLRLDIGVRRPVAYLRER